MDEIRKLLEERLLAFDPTLNVEEGSRVYTQVIQPIVAKFSLDPLNTDTADFLVAKLKESFPTLSVGPGDALYDIVVSASALFLDVYRREASKIKINQSILNLDSMTEDDVDALAANWLLERRQGSFALGTVRIIFAQARSVSFSASTLFSTIDGTTFRPIGAYTVSAETIRTNLINGDQYYIDVQVVAVNVGNSGNVPAGAIVSAVGINGIVSINNELPTVGGADAESNQDLINARLPRAITERALVTERGINARLDFVDNRVIASQVIGFLDPEMERDSVPADIMGIPIGIGIAVTNFRTAVLCLRSLSRAPSIGDQLRIQEVGLNPPAGAGFLDRRATISNIRFYAADDIVLPNTHTAIIDLSGAATTTQRFAAYAVVLYENNVAQIGGEAITTEDHLGGMSDVYIQPSSDETAIAQVPYATDFVIEAGTGATFLGNIIRVSSGSHDEFSRGRFISLGVGQNEGTYKILYSKSVGPSVDVYVHKDLEPGETVDQTWRLCASYQYPLNQSTDILVPYPNESLTVSVLIGRTEVASSIGALEDRIVGGASLLLVDEGVTVPIASAAGAVITLSSEATITYRGPAQIVSSRETISMPLTYVQEVRHNDDTLFYGDCLGAELLSMSSGTVLVSGKAGCILPKYHHAQRLRPFIASTKMDSDSYIVRSGIHAFLSIASSVGGNVKYNYKYTPLSHGMAMPVDKSVVVNAHFGQPSERRSNQDTTNYILNAILPAELFVPGVYNCFVGIGDLSKDSLLSAVENSQTTQDLLTALSLLVPANMPEPISAKSGDLLVIGNDSYIINRVYQISIPLAPYAFVHSDDELAPGTNIQKSMETRVNSPQVLRLSIAVTAQPLPAPKTAELEPGLLLDYVTTDTGITLDTEVTLLSFLRMLLSPEALYQEAVFPLEIAAALQEAEIRQGPRIQEIASLYATSELKTYSVYRCAEGSVRLYFSSADRRYLTSPSCTEVDHHYVDRVQRELAVDPTYDEALVLSTPGFNLSEAICLQTELPSYAPVLDRGSLVESPITWPKNVGMHVITMGFDRMLDMYHFESSTRFSASPISYYNAITYSDPERAAQLLQVGDEFWVCPATLRQNYAIPTVSRSSIYLLEINLVNAPAPAAGVNSSPAADFVAAWQALYPNSDPTSYKNILGQTVEEFASTLTENTFFTYGAANQQQENEFNSLGHFYGISAVAGAHQVPCMASSTARSAEVKIESRFVSEVKLFETAGVPESIAYLGDEEANTVASCTEDGTVKLSRPVNESTAQIAVRGFGRLNPSAREITLLGPNVRYEQNGALVITPGEDNAHGVQTGGTTRFFVDADKGRNIVICPSVVDPTDYGLNSGFAEIPPLFTKVERIESLSVFNPDAGRQIVYAQVITLADESVELTAALEQISAGVIDADPAADPVVDIEVFFLISASDLDVQPARQLSVYDNAYSRFIVDAVSRDLDSRALLPGAALIQTLGNDTPSEVGTVFSRNGLETIRGQAGAPALFVRKNTISVSPVAQNGLYFADVKVQGMNTMLSAQDFFDLDLLPSAGTEGYRVRSDSTRFTFSQKESPYIEMAPIQEVAGNLTDYSLSPIEVSYAYSQTVANTQFRVSNNDERVVCSDILIKRMLPGILDIAVTYTSGPSEDAAAEAIRSMLQSAATNRQGLRTGDVVHLLRRLGATSVESPVQLRLLVIDQKRDRIIRIIKNAFTLEDLVNYAGTARITSLAAPPISGTLGLQVRATRI